MQFQGFGVCLHRLAESLYGFVLLVGNEEI